MPPLFQTVFETLLNRRWYEEIHKEKDGYYYRNERNAPNGLHRFSSLFGNYGIFYNFDKIAYRIYNDVRNYAESDSDRKSVV